MRLPNKIKTPFMISKQTKQMNSGPFSHLLEVSCGIFGGRLALKFITICQDALNSNPLFCASNCGAKHKTQTSNYARMLTLSPTLPFSFLPKDFCFSHTLIASFSPCARLLLFNSGRPDVPLITALPSRTRAENSLGLFGPAAMASGRKKIYSYRQKNR